MPIFDYVCPCGSSEERLVNSSEIDSQTCLVCQSPMAKQVSAPKGYVIGSRNPVKQ